MRKGIAVTFFTIVILTSTEVASDSFTPMHSCYKPIKPFQFNSQYELDSFNSDVEEYQRCISNFVDEQNRAAQNHMNAAEDAIDEWNRFVDFELNN